MPATSLFVRPSTDVYTSKSFDLGGGYGTYSQFNYLRPGLIPRLKRHRFEVALRLARPHFGRGPAIDFGCADGVLVPSLAKFFPRVVAFDTDEDVLRAARALVSTLGLENARVVNNRGMSIGEMREAAGDPARVLFLLETLEHVGDPARLYPSKVEFVEELFALLEPDGVIVVSVPKMVGIPFLLKYGVQTALRLPHEQQSLGQLFRSGFLKDTEALEPHWDGKHNGFNNAKLARWLASAFDVEARRDMLFSEFYVLRRRRR
jgi:2-polyprenyl-3-methyl-5-hydroxy-6-metoxy-1,4-benzoquinol methylase